MARTTQNPGSDPILPAGASEFLARRAKEFLGLGLFLLSVALLVSLLTFSASDPSLNTASLPETVGNMLGLPGAYAADFLLQSFGLAGVLPAFVLGVWGWRLFEKRTVGHLWLRTLALFVGCFLLAMSFGVIPTPETWPLHSGLGGVTGAVLFSKVTGSFSGLLAEQTTTALGQGLDYGVAALCFLFALGILFFACGLALREWRGMGAALAGTAHGARAALKAIHAAAPEMGRFNPPLGRDDDDDMDNDSPVTDALAARRADTPRKTPRKKPSGSSGLVEKRTTKTKRSTRAEAEQQHTFSFASDEGFQLPPLDLLTPADAMARGDEVSADALEQNARLLESVLQDFSVKGRIIKVRPGPVVTLYEFEPAPGTKTSRVISLSDDIARSMSAISVRVAVIPGQNVIGIELPNSTREMVHLRELLETRTYEKSGGKLNLALGKDIGGAPVLADLTRMPHLLIAGTTGSGKSVAVNTMILSLLYRMTPEQCKFIMVDPKMLELSVYDGIPHLLAPVVTDPGKAVVALKWVVREMEDRYRAMAQLGVRNIEGYNERLTKARKKGETLSRTVQTGFDEEGKPVFEDQPLCLDPLPFIVVVVDEMADLMLVAGKDIEAAIQRLAQMARAAGIHLIMATQRPSVDVITGTIKANFPTRISFQVTSKIDSRTILGEQGAEQLLGQGDMLYMAGGGRISRVHGPFVSDNEVERVVADLKAKAQPSYIESVTEEADDAPPILGMDDPGGNKASKEDALYDEAVALVAREGKASTSFIQRHLQIGYNRAARIIERMEAEGVVSKANRVGKREVLVGSH